MKIAIALSAALLTLSLSASRAAEDRPTTFKSEKEIKKSIEKLKGFGSPVYKSHEFEGTKVIVASFCPYSGRADLEVYGYRLEDAVWKQFMHESIPGGAFFNGGAKFKKSDVVFEHTGKVYLKKSILKKEKI